jgi:ferritin-like metal-binding protein YciE
VSKGPLIALAAERMEVLLGAEPKLARAFARLQKKAGARHLRKFCGQGVVYTNRRVRRLKMAFRELGLKPRAKKSAALPGLIADALDIARTRSSLMRDAAILSAIEPISHYGLALYVAIDRYLFVAQVGKAREILEPSVVEKRDAIIEMSEMGGRQAIGLRKEEPLRRQRIKRRRL